MARNGILATVVATTRVLTAIALAACDNPEQAGKLGGSHASPDFARGTMSSGIRIAALPTLGSSAGANGINAFGTFIVGSSADAGGISHPVRWKLVNGAWQLEALANDGRGGGAFAVNAAGWAVGSVKDVGLRLWRTDGTYAQVGCPN